MRAGHAAGREPHDGQVREGAQAAEPAEPSRDLRCFDDRHFEPFMVTTQPYEGLSHATLAWLIENQDQCDVLQVCALRAA